MIDAGKICWPGWKTVGLIGRGSFGAVYEIQRDVLGETERAALKVISIPQNSNDIDEMYSEGYDDESVTATFKEHLKSIVSEYSLMRKMSDCVNIVKCDDIRYVQHDDGIGWDIFIKMELLTPLTKALPEAIPERMVIKLAKDICAALDTCKKYEVIHRDIKPQNIFVSSSGDYKLGDFGIAKVVERTAGGTKIGTYKYMAPEVYNNQPYGRAVDIYSLGLVLYWMLNGRRMPFLPESSKVTTRMEEEARIRRFDGERLPAPANGSARLKAIVLKACAFHPADRYKTPQEMLSALEGLSAASGHSNGNHKAGSGNSRGEAAGAHVDLDVKANAWVTPKEAAEGCTKTVQLAGVGKVNVEIPKGTRDGATLRLLNAGRKHPVSGVKGNAYITVRFGDNEAFGETYKCFFGGDNCSNNKDSKYSGVISSREARKGCSKTFTFKNGTNKTVQIPAGCQNGQVVDSVRIYVHDFNVSQKDMESLPDAVLEMYAARPVGIVGDIVLVCVLWLLVGILTVQIPTMAAVLIVHIVLIVTNSKKEKKVINEAKRILESRQKK